jgi:hypothetical protein
MAEEYPYPVVMRHLNPAAAGRLEFNNDDERPAMAVS